MTFTAPFTWETIHTPTGRDPKHTVQSKATAGRLKKNSVKRVEWPSLSPVVTPNVYFQNGFKAQMLPI